MMQFAHLALVPLQMDEELMFQLSIIGALIGLLLTVGLSYWVYKDASKRGNNELLWTVVVGGLTFFTLFLGIIALIIYLVVRGDETETEPIRDESASGEW